MTFAVSGQPVSCSEMDGIYYNVSLISTYFVSYNNYIIFITSFVI